MIGIEQGGEFADHFTQIDQNENGVQGGFPPGNALLLSDTYIKQNAYFSDSKKPCREVLPPGGAVLDPFAGRASSIFAAASTGRYGLGFEKNEVGWLYAKAKLNPAPEDEVLARNRSIAKAAHSVLESQLLDLPELYTPSALTSVDCAFGTH